MKVSPILLIIFLLWWGESPVVAQNAKVTIDVKQVKLIDVLNEIERQTVYLFFYNKNNIDINKAVTIKAIDTQTSDVLDQILGPDITYSFVNEHIILSKRIPEEKTLPVQQQDIFISGTVSDENGDLLPGVNVVIKGTQSGVITGISGRFSVSLPKKETILAFSSIGFETKEITIDGSGDQEVNIVLKESLQKLEEVSIVGYGVQRKISVVGAVASIKPIELRTGGVSSMSNTLSGRIAGLIGIQRSGEPGKDVTEFWIRGISTFGANSNALILIDGIDRGASGLNDIAPEDIESFSVLKDATATAIYGVRGANGVILINTKRGQEGKLSINANIKTMVESLPRLPEYLRAHDYALLVNEAHEVRGLSPVYSSEIFDIFKYNMDPDLYPDISWQDEILKKNTFGFQGNINVSGGGKLARYYMSGFYRTNDAIYKQSGIKKYHSNVKRNQYVFRSNIDVNVSKSTLISLLLSTKLVDMNRPGIASTDQIWAAQANITPLMFPIRYSNGQLPAYGEGEKISPYVLLNETGYLTERNNSFESLLKIEQDMGFLLDGLRITGSLSFDQFNYHLTQRSKMPELFMAIDRDWRTGELITIKTVEARPTKFDSSSYGISSIYAEAKLDYDKIINKKHRIGALFLYQQKNYQRTDAEDEILSIPRKNQGIAGRLTYSYNDIYFIEGNFGYNGSENFPKGQRFGIFPSIAVGYVVSNYDFFREKLPFVNMLKFRYSYGLAGNDQIQKTDGSNVRFPYLSIVNLDAPGYIYGDVGGNYSGGITDDIFGSKNLVWEKAVKQNFGIDLIVWNAFNINIDFFRETRKDIFMQRVSLPGTVGISSKPWGNIGKMRSWGSDGTISFMKGFGDFQVELRGNYTMINNKIIDYDEVPKRYPYLFVKGSSYGVTRGLISLGLFKDEEEIKNSPAQFGKVLPGDIKYQDVNGDGRIDEDDIVPIGNSNIPKFQYGFAGSVAWKGVDISIFFRGSGKVDYFMGGTGYYPFSGGKEGNVLSIVNEQKNRWTPASYSGDPSTENPNASFPRLTFGENINNNRESSFWLADASFLRLKSLEIGYTFPKNWTEKIKISYFRIALIGDNLHVWDKIKLWDPEQINSDIPIQISGDNSLKQVNNNGAVYPLTRSYSIVMQLSF
ncbi:MAG: TonB-dependent receptor [Bacteroidales bacterium]|jgi:TonB-linked SusC/RagA family outer membrane protein|nr:TonB-dependent receptor [Bacteroidales bacterium]